MVALIETTINPRNITQRNLSLFIYINHFCLIWKSNDISFTQAIKELKLNFKVIDNVVSDEHVKTFIKNEYKPKKFQSPSTNFNVYDLETYKNIELFLMLVVYIHSAKFLVNIIEKYQNKNIKNV